MNWQEPIALALVGLTALLFSVSIYRSHRDRQRGGVGCHCPGANTRGSGPTILVSGRRGQTPTVRIGE